METKNVDPQQKAYVHIVCKKATLEQMQMREQSKYGDWRDEC